MKPVESITTDLQNRVSEGNHELLFFDNCVPIKAWTKGVEFSDEAIAQLREIAAVKFVHHHIAVMPDVHKGSMGSVIGSVVPTVSAFIPAVVGTDLGCGMLSVRTNILARDLPDDLKTLRNTIELAVPHGRTNGGSKKDKGAWSITAIPNDVSNLWNAQLAQGFAKLCHKYPPVFESNNLTHLGTLGTGNHFIEISMDVEERVWITVHTGSRGVGNRIATIFVEMAKRRMEQWYIHLPNENLAFLPEGTREYADYYDAVSWAQTYASVNRSIIMRRVVECLVYSLKREVIASEYAVESHHNYVSQEHHFGKDVWVARNGAIDASRGKLGIIPGSMADKTYIVRGTGHSESFCSCAHGAGRRLSKKEARESVTLDSHLERTRSVECRKDHKILEESPEAYKNIDAVMLAQSDLVTVEHVLTPILNIKG